MGKDHPCDLSGLILFWFMWRTTIILEKRLSCCPLYAEYSTDLAPLFSIATVLTLATQKHR